MLKPTFRTLFVALFLISPVFADDTLSAFHQQDDFSYEEPMSEQSYFATLAPLPSRTSGYFCLNIAGGLFPLKSHVSINSSSPDSDSEKKDTLGLSTGIFLGYGTNIDRFYLATELSINYNFLSKTIDNETDSHLTKLRVRQPIVASLDIIPGYLNSTREILFYGRFGLATSLFKLHFQDTQQYMHRIPDTGLGLLLLFEPFGHLFPIQPISVILH